MEFLFAILCGVGVGTLGTLIGAGGGFILMPVLLFAYPSEPPWAIAALSMLVVCANGVSGAAAYAVRKQIDWKSAVFFTIAAFPGTWVGTMLTGKVEREGFEKAFGVVMLLLSFFLFFKTVTKTGLGKEEIDFHPTSRRILIGSLYSVLIGAMAGFLGIGGGIIHVPLLASVLGYPVHLATGTSHFVLALTALGSVLAHHGAGHYSRLPSFTPYLVGGVLVGAQLGAHLSRRVSSKMILRLLAMALGFVGIRLIF